MAAWSPEVIYAVVALAAILENAVPPAPADVAIALAAFLTHRGETTATGVFLVTWTANVIGAVLVYALARHLGPAFVTSRIGRRLISPQSVVAIERSYLRFGLLGLFVGRLLPGFRSFAAPFAGLVGLSFWRTLVPIALASAFWYGLIVVIGARLGENWEAVSRLVRGLNQTLAVFAGVTLLALGVLWVRSRRRRTRAELVTTLETSLAAYPALEGRALQDPAAAAVAGLLLETTLTGHGVTADELEELAQHLRSRWHFRPEPAAAANRAEVARHVLEALEPAARVGLARRLWQQAFSDGAFQRHEDHVMERVAQLLGLSPEDLAAARRRTGGGGGGG